MSAPINRRELLKQLGLSAAAVAFPLPVWGVGDVSMPLSERLFVAGTAPDSNEARLAGWSAILRRQIRQQGRMAPGLRAARVGELAIGTPYEAFTLEAYLKSGASPLRPEPIALSLTRFDCVTLVESCLAVSRGATRSGTPTWQRFAHEVERMRYRGGARAGYTSRLHYFSEWIRDGQSRGLVRDLGKELGGIPDPRPLRFMTAHRGSYPALRNNLVYREIGRMERRLDSQTRWMIPAARIPEIASEIETGDVLAFATSIPGLDVSHAAFAYRDGQGTLRVLHAPLSGGVVGITRATLPEYVANIRRSTGILVARPLV